MAFYRDDLDSGSGFAYRLAADEKLDQDAYGMLRNNALEHIVSVSYKQFDDRRELRYDIDGLHVARDYFARHVFNRQQFVSLLMGAAGAFAEAEEYMLSAEAFSNSLDTAFVDDHLNMSLTYVPVIGFTGCSGARVFLRDVRRCLEADRSSGDLAYLQTIDEALNDAESFGVDKFRKLLSSLTLKPKQEGSIGLKGGRGFAPAAHAAHPTADGTGSSAATDQVNAGGDAQPVTPNAAHVQQGVSGNMAMPSTSGAPVMFGGMAVPGMEDQQSVDVAPEKKGLFGHGKKEKPEKHGKRGKRDKKADAKKLQKHDKQTKREAKAAEKAAKAAAKEQKKRAKDKGAKKSLGMGGKLPFGKPRDVDIPIGPSRDNGAPLPFAVPGQEGAPGASPSAPVGGEAGAGATPDILAAASSGQAAGMPGDFVPQQFEFSQPLEPNQPSGRSSTGDQYSDQDFGITEVYGITPAKEESRGDAVPLQEAAAQALKEKLVLPVTAYLFRESTGEKRLIDKTPFRVGRRRSEVDFHIAERPKVSRVHAVITFDGTQFSIRDNKSVNRTTVNGQLVSPDDPIALTDGDRVEMGDEKFKFIVE